MKVKMVLSIQGENGQVVIKETKPVHISSILKDGMGGTRTYMDLPDLSIYDKEKTITVDIYTVED